MASYTTQFPPAQNDTYVKAPNLGAGWQQWLATDPTKSVTGDWADNCWGGSGPNQQRFHIDLGEEKIIKRIYIENGHSLGAQTHTGAKDFTFWGSNNAAAFADTTYGTDTNWTELTCDKSAWAAHVGSDVADPQYAVVTNTTPYRYYAMKIATCITDIGWAMRIRRVQLQTQDAEASSGITLVRRRPI